MSYSSHRCLWRPLEATSENRTSSLLNRSESPDQRHSIEDKEFQRIRNIQHLNEILKSDHGEEKVGGNDHATSLTVTKPPERSFIEIVNSSLVVGQEVALTVLLLAIHREIVHDELSHLAHNTVNTVDHVGQKTSIAMVLVYVTLLIIVYYNQKSSFQGNSEREEIFVPRDSYKINPLQSNNDMLQREYIIDDQIKAVGTYRMHQNSKKRRIIAMVRMSDGVLIAVMLRFISGVLCTLTASFSSDTVYALSICGMIIHLLACDYKYANATLADEKSDMSSFFYSSSNYPRPPFLGGTVSLNAVFFSTALLISRIKSNTTSFAFVSAVVTLFAFYPATRHKIARRYRNTMQGSPCLIITITFSTSSWLIISSFEKFLFLMLQLFVVVLSPWIQWYLQRFKQIITGPWDIAHVIATDWPQQRESVPPVEQISVEHQKQN